MRVSLIHLFLIFFCSVASAKPEFFQLQRKDSLLFLSEVNYFSTEQNYNPAAGTFTELANGGSYKNLLVDVGGQYALTPRLYLGGELGFAQAESYDGSFNRNNSGLGEFKIWGQYVSLLRPLRVIPELLAIYPFNRVEQSTDDVLTGEGAIVLQPGVWLGKSFSKLETYGYLGLKYQDEGRATLAMYKLGASGRIQKFNFGGGLSGYEVLLDDQKISSPGQRLAVTNRVQARSLKYYAINPTLMEADVWAGWKFSRTSQFRLTYSQGINGANSAKGFNINLGYQFELLSSMSSLDTSRSIPQRGRTVPEFKTDDEDYDESLFEPPPPPRPAPRRKQQRREKVPQEPSEKQMIEETINSLENL